MSGWAGGQVSGGFLRYSEYSILKQEEVLRPAVRPKQEDNLQYQEFESKFDRRGAALTLVHRIYDELEKGRNPLDGWLPNLAEIPAIVDQWLPEHRFVCQFDPKNDKEPCNWEAHVCGRRCSAAYWRKHCAEVASSLEALAVQLGQSAELWRAAGLLHDLDYVCFPHHDPAIASNRAHPVGISTWLFEKGAPPILVLALLSHAPHLQLRPASALGWATLACDEHATMNGFKELPSYYDSIDPTLITCLQPSSNKLRGFHRNDMEGRANLAMLELTKVLQGKTPAWDPAPSSPIDWEFEVQQAFRDITSDDNV